MCSQTRYSLQRLIQGLDYRVLTCCSPSLGDCFDMQRGRRRALQSTMFNPVLPEPTYNCSLMFFFYVTQS